MMCGAPEGGGLWAGVGDGGGAFDGLAAGPDEGEGDRDAEVAGDADGEWAANGGRADGECEPEGVLDGVRRGEAEPMDEASALGDVVVATAPCV